MKSIRLRNIFVLILLIKAFSATGQKRFSVYYLSIGSGFYKNNTANKDTIRNIESASESAKIMAELITKYGNAKGVTFLATEENMFSKLIIESKLEEVWNIMRKDKAINPLLVIYYCGHGFAENLTKNQFLLSGDCTTTKAKEQFSELSNKHQFVPDIINTIFKLSICNILKVSPPRYMLLMDCCRSKRQNDSLNKEMVAINWGKMAPIVEGMYNSAELTIVNYMDRINKKADPIIYTTDKLNEVYDEAIPDNNLGLKSIETATNIGPLCRRVLLYTNESVNSKSVSVDLESFVAALMKIPDSMNKTLPYTPYTHKKRNNSLFLFFK